MTPAATSHQPRLVGKGRGLRVGVAAMEGRVVATPLILPWAFRYGSSIAAARSKAGRDTR